MPKGNKSCPSCRKLCGPRTITCVCGYNFFDGVEKKEKPEKSSGQRGRKICPHCEVIVGARTLQCDCGYNFKTKTLESLEQKDKQTIIEEEFNWEELLVNDVFEVIGGGDYYISGGVKVNLTPTGKYTVMKKESDGIVAYGDSGTCFIGMKDGQSKNFPCVNKEKHIIRKVSND